MSPQLHNEVMRTSDSVKLRSSMRCSGSVTDAWPLCQIIAYHVPSIRQEQIVSNTSCSSGNSSPL